MDMDFEALRPLVKRSLSYKLFFHTLIADINFWGVVSGIFLQDAPFLAIRLYLLIKHQTISYMMIFFTIKNLMVVLLQIYRFYVICFESYAKVKEAKENFFMTTLSRTPSPRASLSDRRKVAAANRSISSSALLVGAVSSTKSSREQEKKKKERKNDGKKMTAKGYQKRQDYVDKGKSQSMGPLLEQDQSADEMIFENKRVAVESRSLEVETKKRKDLESSSLNEEQVIGKFENNDDQNGEHEDVKCIKFETSDDTAKEEKRRKKENDEKDVGKNENLDAKKLIVFDDEDINLITD
uniref:Uncharacterized protein n=1 Tax=Romanomermis culicivorax TaxID=13658 RepID=A0A915J6A8_ROMCU